MAYDPKDPADKKIVDKLIKDAVEEALASAEEAHEEAVAGLKEKNKELIGKLKKARNGENDDSAAEIDRLEGELAENKKQLSAAQKAAKKAAEERDSFKAQAEGESKFSSNLLVENGLTHALTEHKVAPEFMPAALALLRDKATIKTEGDKRSVVVDGKSLGDYVKEWASSDAGKVYVKAPANGGGGSNGGKANVQQTEKTVIPYADYSANPSAYAQQLREGKASIGPQNA